MRNVTVINKDLGYELKSVVTAIFYRRINHGSFDTLCKGTVLEWIKYNSNYSFSHVKDTHERVLDLKGRLPYDKR